MVRSVLNRRIIAALLSVTLLLGAFVGTGLAAQRHRRRTHRHSKLKGALIGGGVGTVGGALIGGKKGAAIGAGAGAGTGYLIQRHRNRRHRRRG
jgi:osmotically inducible lipoprotein OsmB